MRFLTAKPLTFGLHQAEFAGTVGAAYAEKMLLPQNARKRLAPSPWDSALLRV